MDARQVTTNKIVEGRQFQFKKFKALDGVVLGKLVIEKTLPMLQDFITPELMNGSFKNAVADMTPGIMEKLDMGTVAKALGGISEADLRYLTQKCLSCVSETLPGDIVAVVDAQGNYQIADVEYDPQLMISLIWEQLKFGLADFFNGSRWASILGLKAAVDTGESWGAPIA